MRKVHKTTCNHGSPSSSSLQRYDEDRNTKGVGSDSIPLDLTIDILSRLPVKSLVKFQCVSKLWSSIIRCRDFINSYLTHSSTRPSLLSVIGGVQSAYTISTAQLKNPGEESSYVANPCLTLNAFEYLVSLHGLIFCSMFSWNGSTNIICNPSTRQLIEIPKCKPQSITGGHISFTFFGYDVVNDQYKVLCTMTSTQSRDLVSEYYVFILGAENSWKRIQCNVSHLPFPVTQSVCLNGVLYYGATTDKPMEYFVMVRFDVRSEELNLITLPFVFDQVGEHFFISYEGKLALVNYNKTQFIFWILENPETEEWSDMHFVEPPSWEGIALDDFHGTSYTGELIFTSRILLSDRIEIFYYDLKKNSVRRVEVDGLPIHDRLDEESFLFLNLSFLDHIEGIMFLEDFSSPGTLQMTLGEFQR